jgi:hypothetical protein
MSRIALVLLLLGAAVDAAGQTALEQQNELLFQQLQAVHELNAGQMQKIRAIFAQSKVIGQGNPAVTRHPVTSQQCTTMLQQQSVQYGNSVFERICGGKFMAPLFDPQQGSAEGAKACIDQFEFPNIPCTYPVVWVKAREAAQMCEAEDKRICDAHEWEGACAGSLQPADYGFNLYQGEKPGVAIQHMRTAHNLTDFGSKSWSYGPDYKRGVCATGSAKTPGCPGGNWQLCGSNTYPAGEFPVCHSPSGVYDLNGNVAEHMNLPLTAGQMASLGSQELGYTEMKGSWFIFDSYRAHADWCRWRAPFWHGTRVMANDSHANYHLGFRCCKNVGPKSSPVRADGLPPQKRAPPSAR